MIKASEPRYVISSWLCQRRSNCASAMKCSRRSLIATARSFAVLALARVFEDSSIDPDFRPRPRPGQARAKAAPQGDPVSGGTEVPTPDAGAKSQQENLNDRSRAQGHHGCRLFSQLLRNTARQAVKDEIKIRKPCCSAGRTKTTASTSEADYNCEASEFKVMIQFHSSPIRFAHLIGLSPAHTALAKPPVASSPAVQLLQKLLKRRAKAARAVRFQACPLGARGSVTTSPPPATAATWDAAFRQVRASTRPVPKAQSATAASWDAALRKAARR